MKTKKKIDLRLEMIKNAAEVMELAAKNDLYGAKTPINRLYKIKIELNGKD